MKAQQTTESGQASTSSSTQFFGGGPAATAFFGAGAAQSAAPISGMVQMEAMDPSGLINPYYTPLTATEGDALRERLLAPHRRYDATGFLTQLRRLTFDESITLLEDVAFWNEIRQVHRGAALWTVFTIVYFNNHANDAQRRLKLAISFGNLADTIDALAIIIAEQRGSGFLSEQYWETLIEVIFGAFPTTDPRFLDLYRMILLRDSEHSRPRDIDFRSGEVHYESNASGTYDLRYFGGNRSMTVAATLSEFRVIVRIRLNLQDGMSFFDEAMRGVPERWESAIESVWNNRFIVTDGTDRLNFVVSPIFVFEGNNFDKEVNVMPSEDSTCPGVSQAGRETAGCWFPTTENNVVAHEFGHLLGAKDEYNLPGSTAEITPELMGRLTAGDVPLTTRDGIEQAMNPSAAAGTPRPAQTGGYSDLPSLMNDHEDSQLVYPHHLIQLMAAFNAARQAAAPDAQPYRAIKP
jgi:hypothetical protein